MKLNSCIAVLALLGSISATEIQSEMTIGEKISLIKRKGMRNISEDAYIALNIPSDEVANGDECEDKQLEDEDDPDDDIVDDNGFVHQWVQLK